MDFLRIRTCIVGGLILALAAVPLSAAEYEVVNMGSLGGVGGRAYDINNAGVIVGMSRNSAGISCAFIYADGVMRQLDPGCANDFCEANSINDAGEIAGYTHTSTQNLGVKWSGSTATRFGNGMMTVVYGMSPSGKVVGCNDPTMNDSRGFVYDGSWTFIDPHVLGGAWSWLVDMNASGVALGQGAISSGATRAFSYRDGVATDIGTLGGTSAFPGAINDSGQIVGWSSAPEGERAFLYSGTTMANLGTVYRASRACGLNNYGVAVGYYKDSVSVR